jgi:hypothetical protein
MDKNKIDTQTVYEMFEELNKKLDKQADNTFKPAQTDMTAFNTMNERLENVIEEVKKPTQIEHHLHHTVSIASNWFFFSWVALVVIILGLFWAIANQRQTISQYKDNDLKYRYIKMQGQTNEENLYRLEQQFQHGDSIKIIRSQVEKYEELVKEQAERMEKMKLNTQEAETLRNKVEYLKKSK